MGKFLVTGPDGTKYEVNAPDGATQDDAIAYVQKNMAKPYVPEAPVAGGSAISQPKVDNRSIMEKANDYQQGLQNSIVGGLTGGFADEVAATGGALAGSAYNLATGKPAAFGDEYNASLDYRRGKQKQFASENPGSNFAGELVGAVVSPLTKALMGKGVPANAPMTQRTVNSGLAGGRMGAVYGAGNAEGGIPERIEAAGEGAVTGAALGGIAPAAVDAVGAGGRMVWDRTVGLTKYAQDSVAGRKLAEALARDGVDPNYYQAAEHRLNQIGPDAALMDIGGNTRGLARSAYTTPGEGKKQIGDFLTARQEGTRDAGNILQGGQAGRVTGQIEALVPGNAQVAQDATVAARGKLGAKYEAAKAVEAPVDTAPLIAGIDKQLENAKGGIQKGLSTARSYLLKADGSPDTSVAGLHEAKMAIGDLISGTGDSSMGRTAQARLKAVQADLVDAIEKAAPDYRTGRLGTSAEWQKSDALEAGAKLFSKAEFSNPQQMEAALAKMGPDELHHFRIGAVQALKDKIGDMVSRADVTKKLMDVPALEAKIRLAFGDDAVFKKYIDGLMGEKAMFKSYGDIVGGSRTGEVIAENADAGIDPGKTLSGLARMASTNPLDWIVGGGQAISGAAGRLVNPQSHSKALAKLLTGQDASVVEKQLKMVPVNQRRRQAIAKALTITGGQGQ
jgi:hypothetical protein